MLYNEFKTNCISFKNTQLSSPRIIPKEKFLLPLNSVYHVVEEGFGIFAQDDEIINNYLVKDKATVEHILGYEESLGLLGLTTVHTYSKDDVIKEFELQNKRFHKFNSAKASLAKDKHFLHIVNHGNVFHEIIQKEESMQEYHEFMNFWRHFFFNLNKIAKNDSRYHFFKLEVPVTVPPVTILDSLEEKEKFTVSDLGKLTDNLQLMTLNFWRWFNVENEVIKALSVLSYMSPEILERVHVIYDLGKSVVVLNLELLVSWIKTATNKKGHWSYKETRKKYLTSLVKLADVRANNIPAEDLEGELDKADELLNEIDENDDILDDDTLDENYDDDVVTLKENKKPKKAGFYKKDKPKDEDVSDYGNVLSNNIRNMLEKDDEEFIADDNEKETYTLNTDVKDEQLLENLEEIQQAALDNKNFGEYEEYKPVVKTLDQPVTDKVNEIASKGLLTTAERNRFNRLANSWENITAPNGQSMKEYLEIKPEDKLISNETKIAQDMAGVLDKSFLNSTLKKMDKVYVEKFLDKHVHQMVIHSIQREGIIVKDIKRTHVKTLIDDYYQYSVKVIPVVGEESTITFRIPRVTSDGTMIARGVKVRMRKQRADLPVRKLSHNKVSLTSYHSKFFVTRAERVVNSYDKWLEKQIYLGTLTEEVHVKELVYGDCFDMSYVCPRIYSVIARTYTSFSLGPKAEYHLNFDCKTHANTKVNKSLLKGNEVVCGDYNGIPIVIDDLGILTLIKDNKRELIGDLETMIGVPESASRPIPMIDVGPIAGKEIPLGVLLSYYLGLGNFLKTMGIEHRRVVKGSRLNLERNEFPIAFSDQTLVIKNLDPIKTGLINGFTRYKAFIAGISIWEFDKKEGYVKLFDANGIRTRQMHRLDQIRTNWIDPITEDILVQLGYPTDMVMLLIEAAKLLELDNHPDETDINYSRIRGYERISGMIYGEIMNSLTAYHSMPARTAKVTMNPETVWYDVTTDQTTAPVEDSNPIQAIKDKSVVVFSGAGGRAGNTLMAKDRRFSRTGIGVNSLDTVDSGDVATIVYLSANPNVHSIYGMSSPVEEFEGKNSSLYSDSDLLVPGSKYDD